MKISELKDEKTVKALVKRLLAEQPKGRVRKSETEMEEALLRSNPHLHQIDNLEKGTPILVPEEFALDGKESESPFAGMAEELIRQSESVLTDLRAKLAEQVTESAKQAELAQEWVQSEEAKQLLRSSPELKAAFSTVPGATKQLAKDQAAALLVEDKALEKVRAALSEFRQGKSG